MNGQADLKFLGLLENITHHFAFLFRRGFQIVSVIFVDQNYEDWQVTMTTDNCIIKIYSYMGKVDLALSIPQLYNTLGLLEVGDLISGINGNGDFSAPTQEPRVDESPDLLKTAQLLEKYIDDILERIRKMLLLLSFDDPPVPPSKFSAMFLDN